MRRTFEVLSAKIVKTEPWSRGHWEGLIFNGIFKPCKYSMVFYV